MKISPFVVFVCAASLAVANAGGRPVRLLEADARSRKLVLAAEGLEMLRKNFTGPVTVVTFVGLARSGKSFGLNVLLDVPHALGFRVGHTFETETSGAAVWSESVSSPSRSPAVLVVDTEGLGAGAQVFDKPILAIAAAVSSRLVYHMSGPIVYNDDVLRLHGLATLVEDYRRRGILASSLLPHVTWVLNKSELAKKSPTLTDAEVLFSKPQIAEQDNPDGNPQIAMYNATVRVVRSAFVDHFVHLVPTAAPPGATSLSGAALAELPLSQLSPPYLAAMAELRAEIAAEPPRFVPGSASRPMTGPDVANLLELVLPAANEGVEHVGDRMADAIARRRVADAKSELERRVAALDYPMEEDALELRFIEIQAEAGREYRATTPAESALAVLVERYSRELDEKISAERLRAWMTNSAASDKACEAAAREAAELFSHDALTNNGTRELDMDEFEVGVRRALAQYQKIAVGPRKRYHADQLEKVAQSARDSATTETAPARQKVVLGGTIVIAAACHGMRQAILYLPGGTWAQGVLGGVLYGVGNVAAGIALLGVLSIFGYDELLPFATVVKVIMRISKVAHDRGATIGLAVAALVATLTAIAKLTREKKKQR